MPSDMWTSTVSSNLARFIDLSRLTALPMGTGPSLAIFCTWLLRWLRSFLPRFGLMPGCLPLVFFFGWSPAAAGPAPPAEGVAFAAAAPSACGASGLAFGSFGFLGCLGSLAGASAGGAAGV